MTTIRDSLSAAAERLAAAGVVAPRTDAELLLAEVLRLDRLRLVVEKDRNLSEEEERDYAALVARREGREPLQYILGRAEFMGLEFRCDRRALIPRPETERLCERALELLERRARKGRPARLLDLGTGCGCVAVALGVLAPPAAIEERGIWATDVSGEALALARENAELHGVAARFAGFFRGDLYAALPDSLSLRERGGVREQGQEAADAPSPYPSPEGRGDFDLVIANLPYVSDGERERLAPEIREHEPAVALYGGADGLEILSRCIAESPARLAPGGRLLLEMAEGQFPAVRRLLLAAGFDEARVWKDLAGIERVAEGIRG